MYDPDCRGALFRTQDKRRESSPDYYGRVQVDGKRYKLAGWITTPKKNSSGPKYISLRLTLEDV